MVERATWWASSGPCAHGSDWETGSSIELVEKLGRVPRWWLALGDRQWFGEVTGTGASVDAFALGDRQCVWYDETGTGASVDAFALGDRQ